MSDAWDFSSFFFFFVFHNSWCSQHMSLRSVDTLPSEGGKSKLNILLEKDRIIFLAISFMGLWRSLKKLMKAMDLYQRKEGHFFLFLGMCNQLKWQILGFLCLNPVQIIRKLSLIQFLLRARRCWASKHESHGRSESEYWAHFLTTGQENEKTR